MDCEVPESDFSAEPCGGYLAGGYSKVRNVFVYKPRQPLPDEVEGRRREHPAPYPQVLRDQSGFCTKTRQ